MGLLKRSPAGGLVIANPIYREVLPRVLAQGPQDSLPIISPSWLNDRGELNPDALLDAFLAFWLQHGEPLLKSASYPEIAPHLVLMAFLHRVINGGGTLERESAIGRDRMDLCLRCGQIILGMELKVWRTRKIDVNFILSMYDTLYQEVFNPDLILSPIDLDLKSVYKSARVFLRKPTEEDIKKLLSLHQRSQDFHFPWVAPPLTERECKNYIARCQNDDFEGLLICHSTDNNIIGVVNLSQNFYRAFQNAYLGYYVDVDFADQGLMSEGITLAINYAFYDLDLHRVEANIQPENRASINLVERLGFTKEGFSRRYLKINGEWRDHERWALTVENWA